MKRFSAFLIVVSLLFRIGPLPEPAYALPSVPALPISAKSAILVDAQTNRILYSKTPHRKAPPASTTKLLTALVVMDRLPMKKVIRVPYSAERIPASKINLKGGEEFYVQDLLRALLISSANDVAHTLAVSIVGSEWAFSRLMNQKARRIGCRETRFANASGLPASGQYSTAYDLALIMREARKNPFIVRTLREKSRIITALTGRTIYLKNHNKMLWRAPNRIVGKTGFTRKARHCFVGGIRHGSKEILVAILGSLRPWHDLRVLWGLVRGSGSWIVRANRGHLSKSKVYLLQAGLERAGFNPGPRDGVFGEQTLRAVRAFQTSRGLRADGIVGEQTLQKLKPFLSSN